MVASPTSRRIGGFLVDRRVLSRDDLERLLDDEHRSGVPLADQLAESGAVGEKDLTAAVADVLGLAFVDLDDQIISPDLWAIVPRDLATNYHAVAAARTSDGGMLVALDDPDDQLLTALEEDLGCTITPALAARGDLDRVIAEMYSTTSEAEGEDNWANERVSAERHVELGQLLMEAFDQGGSDLHLTLGMAPMVRIDGALRALPDHAALTGSEIRRLLYGALPEEAQRRFETGGALVISHRIPGRGRVRISSFVRRDSLAATLRLVDGDVPQLSELGLPDDAVALLDAPEGLVLVVGPPGSGRSTTVAAAVERLAFDRPGHILCVEDPIEFLHRHQTALVNQREVGGDTPSMAAGLRDALRQDVDVLVVAPLGDGEAVEVAVEAAGGGRLVLAEVTGNDLVVALHRLVGAVEPPRQRSVLLQLSSALVGAVVQRARTEPDGRRVVTFDAVRPDDSLRAALAQGDLLGL